MSDRRPNLDIRPARADDRPQILALLSRTLGWENDNRHRDLFEWKHERNPFGPSPAWVAHDDAGLVGFRALMRWEFLRGSDPLQAVRAVDTATDPRARGTGVFRALTLQAVEDLKKQDIQWVFNTPNAQSRPGYLSMGWQPLGRLPIRFRAANLLALRKLGEARAAGELWSLPTDVGEPASDLLSHESEITDLLLSTGDSVDRELSLRSRRSPTFLSWRYGHCPVGYRGLRLGASLTDGVILFRTRRRGTATELVISETIVPLGVSHRSMRRSLNRLLAATRADYAVALGTSRPRGWLPLPGKGPLLTWRELAWSGPAPTLGAMKLSTGDVELF